MASPVSIPTLAGGALKGALRLTPGATRAALLLHPHPSYGGNMDNPVLSIGEESLCRQGYATLRFNFNTVGKSGVSDGSSEIQDVQAALQFLREKTSQGEIPVRNIRLVEKVYLFENMFGLDTKVILFGYSFGCGVGFEFARLYPKTVEAMVAVAPAPENVSVNEYCYISFAPQRIIASIDP